MKPYLVTVSILFFYSSFCFSQLKPPRSKALSIELGKTGLIYNLAYDYKLPTKNFGFRLVAGSNFGKYIDAYTFGAGTYYLAGQAKSFLELGTDLHYLSVDEVSDDQKIFAFVYPDYSIKTLYVSGNIGYRWYGKSNMFRIGVSPGWMKPGFIPGGYVSYGVIF